MYPAKYSFSATSTSCSDFVVYPTGRRVRPAQRALWPSPNFMLARALAPASASGANAPVDWAYNTGGMATTSPVLSGDGTQVAYIQVSSGGVASLVVLKPLAGDTGRRLCR